MSRVRNLIDFNHRSLDFDGDNSDDITVNNIELDGQLTNNAAGTPKMLSSTDIVLQAGTGANNRVEVNQSLFAVASFTTAQLQAKTPQNGDLGYDRDLHKLAVYSDGSWATYLEDGTAISPTSITMGQTTISSTNIISGGNIGLPYGNLELYDNRKIIIGTGGDLEIYHDGTNSIINDLYIGDLLLKSSNNTKLTVGDVLTANTDLVVEGSLKIADIVEAVDLEATQSGVLNVDVKTNSVVYLFNAQTANRTINIRGNATDSINSMLSAGESVTCAILMTNGPTPFYFSTVQVDGNAVTPKWGGGNAPSSGNASSIDTYTFTVIKTASNTYTVLASQSQYA